MHQGVGQSADEVWRALQVQQPQIQTPEPTAPEPVAEPPLIFVAAFCALSGIWAGRAGGGRTAESRFIAVVGSASPVLSSPSAGVHSKGR